MIGREELEQTMLQYKTPLYLFDLEQLEETARRVRRTLKNSAGLCFAMKANPLVVKQMAQWTDRIEVCSMGEYQICREQGIPPEKLLISGVLKKPEELCRILADCGARARYTAESLGQLMCLAEWSEEKKEPLLVYLRLTSGNQFGMERDTIESILEAREMFPFLRFQGIHFFSGTQKRSAAHCEKELVKLDSMLLELEQETGYEIRELEYGPGLSISYFEGQAEHTLEDLETVRDTIGRMRFGGRTVLEMGRALCADCGYYLTKIQETKTNGGRHYCIVDGGVHQMNYDGQIRGMYLPKITVCPEPSREISREWTVCGALCTVNDILAQRFTAGNLRPGNVLAFHRAGAYSITEGMALFLSHALPRVVFYSREQGWRLVREECPTYPYHIEKETEHGTVKGNSDGNRR